VPVIELTLEMTAAVVYPLTVKVYKGGEALSGANVIVVSKAIPMPSFYTSKTDATGRALFYIPNGTYLVLADDGENYRDFKDEVYYNSSQPTTVTLNLVEKKTAKYYVKLILKVDAAQYLAPIVNAIAQVQDKVLELAGSILTPLGITMPATELAKHFDIEGVEGVKNEITIWIKYTGSPVPQAVVLALIGLAICVIVFIIAPLLLKWLFGEKLPEITQMVAIAIGLVAVASIIGSLATVFKK
jgi:hypothetical protein